ncbi:MAG TPA: response regulator [Paracoccaceae bacterium]|nr:response regulator [Paracoccaceae bacterium]
MSATEPAQDLAPLSVGATILIVEDCLANAEAMRLMARACGIRVRHAKTMEAAERHLVRFRPALAIVDLGLPDGDGVELLRRIAAEPAARPRLLAVSADETALADPEVGALADARAAKPFASVAAFEAAIAGLLPDGRLPAGPVMRAAGPAPDLVEEELQQARSLIERGLAADDGVVVARGARLLAGLAGEIGDERLRAAALGLERQVRRGERNIRGAAEVIGLCAAPRRPGRACA